MNTSIPNEHTEEEKATSLDSQQECIFVGECSFDSETEIETPIEKLAWKYAFDQVLSESVDGEDGFTLIHQWEKSGQVPEKLVIWEPYENYSCVQFLNLIESTMTAFINFYEETQKL